MCHWIGGAVSYLSWTKCSKLMRIPLLRHLKSTKI